MELFWKVSDSDILKLKKLISDQGNHPMVLNRRKKNLKNDRKKITRSQFWESMIGALLSSQQKSGLNSKVSKFRKLNPNPISLDECYKAENLANFINFHLNEIGGIRFHNRVSEYFENNFLHLQESNWEILRNLNSSLPLLDFKEEQKMAVELMELKGIKSKQSRNMLQNLGLTRYEIPIDSRVMNWLNFVLEFPIKLSPQALQDENFYRLVLSGLRKLCSTVEIYPCELDAMVFSLKEKQL